MPILPQVNLNGTSAGELLSQQLTVLDAARNLRVALQAAFPHGRDYQHDASRYPAARDEAVADLQHLDAIIARADAIALHVVEHANARRA